MDLTKWRASAAMAWDLWVGGSEFLGRVLANSLNLKLQPFALDDVLVQHVLKTGVVAISFSDLSLKVFDSFSFCLQVCDDVVLFQKGGILLPDSKLELKDCIILTNDLLVQHCNESISFLDFDVFAGQLL